LKRRSRPCARVALPKISPTSQPPRGQRRLFNRERDSSRSPLNPGANTEFVMFWICHSDPTSLAEALYTLVNTARAKGQQAFDLRPDVFNDDIDVHSVLRELWLGNALKDQW